jgi:hypothetical protein
LPEGVLPEKLRNSVIINGIAEFPLPQNELQNELSELPTTIYVANIMHEGQLYVAAIPSSLDVTQVDFQKQLMPILDWHPLTSIGRDLVQKLNELSAHARVRFQFAEPVRLIKKINTDSAGNVSFTDTNIPVDALSISPEGMTLHYDINEGASIQSGTKYAFGHFLQTDSVPRAAFEGSSNRVAEMYHLTSLDEQDRKNVFWEALLTAQLDDFSCGDSPEYTRDYNTITSNCISESLKIIQRGAGTSIPNCENVNDFLISHSLTVGLVAGNIKASIERTQRSSTEQAWMPSRIGCYLHRNNYDTTLDRMLGN